MHEGRPSASIRTPAKIAVGRPASRAGISVQDQPGQRNDRQPPPVQSRENPRQCGRCLGQHVQQHDRPRMCRAEDTRHDDADSWLLPVAGVDRPQYGPPIAKPPRDPQHAAVVRSVGRAHVLAAAARDCVERGLDAAQLALDLFGGQRG